MEVHNRPVMRCHGKIGAAFVPGHPKSFQSTRHSVSAGRRTLSLLHRQPRALLLDVAEDVPAEYAHFATPGAGILVCDPPAVYRPRHPEAQVFYQVFEQHFDSYAAAYEERFEPRSGRLRDSFEQFLACGRLQGSFVALRARANT